MRVIPAINAKSFKEIKKRIKIIEPYCEWVQLDVADGTFAKNTIWHNAADLLSLKTRPSLNIEIHLMISGLEERIENWLIAPVNRLIFHLEAAKDPYFIIKKCKEAKKEVGVAIAPPTSWTRLMGFCNKVDLFQILAVYPGLTGQEFQNDSLDKIKYLRENCPSAIIEVDGGINKETAKKAAEAGADIAAAASYIFNSKKVKKAIEELKQI
jgi:ribulose-phosphate 3-epimerase